MPAQAGAARHPGVDRRGPAAHGGGGAGALKDAAERAEENAALLSKTVLTIPQQAGDDGRLFGSVTAQDIVDAIRQARGLKLDRRKVQLDEPIRTTGTHMVTVEVSEGVTATVKTIVTPQT